MREYFHYDVPEEDTVMFVLTDDVRQTPEKQMTAELNEYIATHEARIQAAGSPRAEELEARATDFARLLLGHIESGTTPPQHKSYHLKT